MRQPVLELVAAATNSSRISLTSTTPYLILVVVGTVFAVATATAAWTARAWLRARRVHKGHVTMYGWTDTVWDEAQGKHVEVTYPGLVDLLPAMQRVPGQLEAMEDKVDKLGEDLAATRSEVAETRAEVAANRTEVQSLGRQLATLRRTQVANARASDRRAQDLHEKLAEAGVNVPSLITEPPLRAVPVPRQRKASS